MTFATIARAAERRSGLSAPARAALTWIAWQHYCSLSTTLSARQRAVVAGLRAELHRVAGRLSR